MSHVDPNCQHGMLRRGCDLCEMIVQNADLRARVAELEALLIELTDIEGPQPGTTSWARKVWAALGIAEPSPDRLPGNKDPQRNEGG